MTCDFRFRKGSQGVLQFGLLLMVLLAGDTTLNVDCAKAQAGCTSTNISTGSAVPVGSFPVNCRAGQPCAVQAGATCGASSTQCDKLGDACTLGKKCRNTYNIVSSQCLCQCRI